MAFLKYFFLKSLGVSLLSLSIVSQMDLGAAIVNAPSEDYIQEIIDSKVEWDANQLSEMYTQVNIAAKDAKDIGITHVAARSAKDIGLVNLAARSSKDIGAISLAARSSKDIGRVV